MRPIHRVLLFFSLPLLLILAAGPAGAVENAADDPVSWQVYPGGDLTGRPHFDLTTDPGGTVSGTVVIRNLSETDLRLAVYGADASTGADGAFTLRESSTGDVGLLGSWLRPAQTVVDVPALSDARVPFEVVVPDDAPPGDYGGAILTSWNDSSGATTSVVARVGARVHLQVAGDLQPQVTVSDPTLERDATWWNPFTGELAVSSTVTNTGNTRLQLTGAVTAGGLLGEVTGDLAPTGVELWPGDSVEVAAALESVPSFFSLGAEVSVRATVVAEEPVPLDIVVATADLTVLPWTPVLALLAIAAVVLVVLRRRRRPATVPPTRDREAAPVG